MMHFEARKSKHPLRLPPGANVQFTWSLVPSSSRDRFFRYERRIMHMENFDDLLRYFAPGSVFKSHSLFPSSQVINHGIDISTIGDAFDAAAEFFNLPHEEKISLASANVLEPVRYGTSLNHAKDRVRYWRDFIKHYSHPISTWIDLWPSNPSCYRKKMGTYAQALHMFQKQVMEVVFESLGLNPNYLNEDTEEGSQVMAVNCYPACPEPDLVLGMPPHSDYGYLTILAQNHPGLEIMDHNRRWHPVPLIKGALVIQLGDQTEVISNGRYKSPIHRATVNSETNRISMASLHSLAYDRKVRPAPELVDEQHVSSYREGSFGEFLDFLTENDITKGSYKDTLRKNP